MYCTDQSIDLDCKMYFRNPPRPRRPHSRQLQHNIAAIHNVLHIIVAVFHYFVAFNPGVTRARTRVNPLHSKYNAAALFKITFNKLYYYSKIYTLYVSSL